MVPPPPVPVVAQPPHPNAMYHPQQRNQQQHPNGYPYSSSSQPIAMNRYGPPPMHTMAHGQQHQQHTRAHHHHHHQTLTGAPNNYRHPPPAHGGASRHAPQPPPTVNASHHHYHHHHALMVPGAPHSMGQQVPHRHPYPPRPYHVPHSHSQVPPPHSTYAAAAAKQTGGVVQNCGSLKGEMAVNDKSLTKENAAAFTSEVEKHLTLSKSDEKAVTVKNSIDNLNLHSQTALPTVSFKECIDPTKSSSLSSKSQNDGKVIGTPKDSCNSNPTTVMSPITMCFTRMLGAAEAIKTPGSSNNVNSKKRGPLSKKTLPLNPNNNIRNRREGESNPFDEIQEDPDLERLVILQMAMQRSQHLSSGIECSQSDALALPPQPKREVSRVISEGFFWREYPACEQVLYNHMHKYYEISAIQKNYKVQQYFNNVLVEEVRQAALDSGFTVDPEFCDKMLRDRIRCFYKTHLQNAKKRLATMMKHSDSMENQCLVAVFIRCARNPDLSFEESLAMGNNSTLVDTETGQENITLSKNDNQMQKMKPPTSERADYNYKSVHIESESCLSSTSTINALQVRPMNYEV